MSDLSDELQQLAAHGAGQARPLAVADVIRKGNRRRARTIGQKSLGGLSVLGIGAAIVVTGGTAHSPASDPAASAKSGVLTTSATSSSSAGTMTVVVRFLDEAHSKVKVLSVSYSGHARAVLNHAALEFSFGPALAPVWFPPGSAKGGIANLIVTARRTGPHDIAGSLSERSIGTVQRAGGLPADEPIRVTLTRERRIKNGRTVITVTQLVASVGLVLVH